MRSAGAGAGGAAVTHKCTHMMSTQQLARAACEAALQRRCAAPLRQGSALPRLASQPASQAATPTHVLPSLVGSRTSTTSTNFSSMGPSSASPGASSASGALLSTVVLTKATHLLLAATLCA